MDSSKNSIARTWMRFGTSTIALAVLVLLCSAGLRAQTVSLGGTGALGNFINPATVKDASSVDCNYDLIEIDLSQTPAKVFARPFHNGSNSTCNTTLVDITNIVDPTTTQKPFSIPPAGAINDGVLEVVNFTLQQSTLTGAQTPSPLTLAFVPNANNTPIWLRATGNITINGNTVLSVAGAQGGSSSGFLRGVGGQGGPGGFRGGDGGNGGLSPSNGGAGFGPGGGPGGAGSAGTCGLPPSGSQFVSTGVTVTSTTGPAAAIPSGNDLLTLLRGGSGGGGQGGCNSNPGGGGGGGGGAILVAANNTITVNGQINATGGQYSCCSNQMAGAGGTIRLVSATIAGNGTIFAHSTNGPASSHGIVRLEAFTISFSGSFGSSNVAATSAPGQIVLPTSPTAFIQFASLTDTGNPSNFCNTSSGACNNAASSQTFPGRTGSISSPDVTMPNFSGSTSAVNVVFTIGPNTVGVPWPAGKTVTLEVAPLDPAQGAKTSYQTSTINCPAPGAGNCSATISNVSLPLGFSSMSAFTVVNLNSNATLARSFPASMEGEPIESVKIQTGRKDKDTEYVLISKSGREFPYKPGTPR